MGQRSCLTHLKRTNSRDHRNRTSASVYQISQGEWLSCKYSAKLFAGQKSYSDSEVRPLVRIRMV